MASLACCKFLGAGSNPASTFPIFILLHINHNLHCLWQYFAVTKHADAKEGWTKNATCNFVIKALVDVAIQECYL